MATVAAPTIDWSGGTPPQAQTANVAVSTLRPYEVPLRYAVTPVPQVTELLDDPGVGYSG